MALSGQDPTLALGGLSLAVALFVAYRVIFSRLRAFPGPFPAKLTDAFRAYLTTLGDVDVRHRAWHRRWGPAVRIGPNTLSLSDPDLIKVVYTSKNAWIKSDMYRPNDVVVNGQRIPNIFNTQDKAFHSKYTKPIGGFWTLTRVLELEPLFDETVSLFTDTLGARFVDGTNAGKTCMMDEWMTYFAWDAAANASFGRHYGFIESGKDVEGILSESTAGLRYFAPVSQIPWLDEWLDKNPIYRIGPKPLVNGFLYTVKLLTEYQAQLAAGTAERKPVEQFIDKYNGLKKTHPDLVDDNQVINWLMLNVLAGGDSTAGTIRAVVYHLGRHPEQYERMVAELLDAKLSLPAQWRDLYKLEYFDAVIRESCRLTPSVGLVLERLVPEGGFELPDGRFVPAGVKVGLNPAVVTRDPGVFGDRVDDFCPERWLRRRSTDGDDNDGGESDTDFTARHRRMQEATDLMFGAGNRACMGKHFAKLEIYKVLGTLYSIFDVKLVKPDHEWNYFNSWFMYQSDIPMTLTRRR